MTSVPTMETTVYGKWILAGEHAVIRGAPAVVFPVFAKSLRLRYRNHQPEMTVEFGGEHGSELRLLFWGVMEKALQMTGRTRKDAGGHFVIENDIPIGAGLGASGALCAGVGRWFSWKGWVAEAELPEFCRELENLFHGESSGVDVAVALSGRGMHYERRGDRYPVDPAWKPNWYLSYSGKRGITSECIAKVRVLWDGDSALGERLDRQMGDASVRAQKALMAPEGSGSFEELAGAINQARECFENWGLTKGEIGQHIQMLQSEGAVAVKPTGSGDGGYVLSLWRSEPPASLKSQLIPL